MGNPWNILGLGQDGGICASKTKAGASKRVNMQNSVPSRPLINVEYIKNIYFIFLKRRISTKSNLILAYIAY